MPLPLIIGGAALAGSLASNIYDNYQRGKRTDRAYNDINNAINAASAANDQDIANYKSFIESTYGKGAASYEQALQDFLSSPVYQNKGFEYTGDVSDYMDPAVNQQMAAAMDAINASSSTGHNRFSSDYVNAVAQKQRALSSEGWRDAYDRMMQDRSQQLSKYNTNAQNAWNNYNASVDRQKYGIDAYGNDRNAYTQGISDATMAGLNNRMGTLQSQVNATTGLTNAQNAQSGIGSQILGPAAQFMGAYFGSKK